VILKRLLDDRFFFIDQYLIFHNIVDRLEVIFVCVTREDIDNIVYGENEFEDVSKNLAGYRSENNFGPSK